jgi:hypothetical protein
VNRTLSRAENSAVNSAVNRTVNRAVNRAVNVFFYCSSVPITTSAGPTCFLGHAVLMTVFHQSIGLMFVGTVLIHVSHHCTHCILHCVRL